MRVIENPSRTTWGLSLFHFTWWIMSGKYHVSFTRLFWAAQQAPPHCWKPDVSFGVLRKRKTKLIGHDSIHDLVGWDAAHFIFALLKKIIDILYLNMCITIHENMKKKFSCEKKSQINNKAIFPFMADQRAVFHKVHYIITTMRLERKKVFYWLFRIKKIKPNNTSSGY